MAGEALITGGAGFIGSSPRRAAAGRRRGRSGPSTTSRPGRIDERRAPRDRAGFHLVVDSVLQSTSVNELVHKCDVVYHLAAAVGVRLDRRAAGADARDEPPRHRDRPRALPPFGKRVLVASTSEVYGDHREETYRSRRRLAGSTARRRSAAGRTPTRRRWTSSSRSPTSRSTGSTASIARLFNTVGPRQSGAVRDGHPDASCSARSRGGRSRSTATATQTRCFCHVEDTIRALQG